MPVEEAGSQPVAVVEEEDEDESEEEDGDGDQGNFHSPRPSLFTQGWREERDRNLSDSVSSDSSQSITSRMLAMLDAGNAGCWSRSCQEKLK